MSNLLIASAFLALLYIVYAVVQTVRGKTRAGAFSILLACLAVIVPTISLALDTVSAASQPLLTTAILANAVIVLVISAVIVVLDYRKTERSLGHSFGTLGLGVSILLGVSLFSTPLIITQFTGGTAAAQVSAADFASFAGGTISDETLVPAAFSGEQMPFAASTGQQMPATAGSSELQSVLQAQTGLTNDELLAQLEAGSALADLVTAQGGDMSLVTSALADTLETAITEGTLPQPMLDRLGGDAETIAASMVQGDVPPMLLMGLLGGTLPQGGGPPAGFAPPAAAGGELPTFVIPDAEVTPATDEASVTAAQQEPVENEQPAAPVIAQTARATATPLPTPTPFMFDLEPTAALVVAEASESEAQTAVQTCALTVQFNLNMRAEPNPEGAWIVTIPAYTSVISTGQNGDNWWQVSYEDATGWVSGDYVSADRSCDALPVIG